MRDVATNHTRPIWAEVSASALISNLNAAELAARRQVGAAAGVIAVIKANAYGHGARECAPVLAATGVAWLGVTSVGEGVTVRRSLGILPQNISPNVLVMCGVWPGEIEALLQNCLTPVIWEPYHLDLLEAEARTRNMPPQSLAVHVEIETGMARQGVPAGPILGAFLERFTATSPLRLDGVLTHMASTEEVGNEQNDVQMRRFEEAFKQIESAGFMPSWVHAGNTSAIDGGVALRRLVAIAERSGALPLGRSGLGLYGYTLPLEPDAVPTLQPALKPALTWKTRVVSLREIAPGDAVGYSSTYIAMRPMRLALLPVGYADGFRRELSSTNERQGGAALIQGQRAPIVGRVSMDLTVVDITAIPGVAIGDEAVLLGSQGSETISAEEHAELAETIVYEILCGISDRVPRIVVE